MVLNRCGVAAMAAGVVGVSAGVCSAQSGPAELIGWVNSGEVSLPQPGEIDETTGDFNEFFGLIPSSFFNVAELEAGEGVVYASVRGEFGGELSFFDPEFGFYISTLFLFTLDSLLFNSELLPTAMEFVDGRLIGSVRVFGSEVDETWIVEIDTFSGEVFPLFNAGTDFPLGGLAYDGSRLLGSTAGGSQPAELYEFDLVAETSSFVGLVLNCVAPPGDDAISLTGLEYGNDGILYGLGRNPDNFLYSIDASNGMALPLGEIQDSFGGFGLGLNGITAREVPFPTVGEEFIGADLLGWDNFEPALNVIDETIPEATSLGFVPSPGDDLFRVPEVEFCDGMLIASSGNDGSVLTVLDGDFGDYLFTTFLFDPMNSLPVSLFDGVWTALEGVDGVLYGVLSQRGGPVLLAQIDPLGGEVTFVGDLGLTSAVGGLAWDGTTLYASQAQGAAPAELYTIDLGTGAATVVATISGSTDGVSPAEPLSLTGLEFGSDGVLYGLGRSPDDVLYSIDPGTGDATFVAAINTFGLTAITSRFKGAAGPDLDFDGNGVVNISDLFAFITAFTMTPPDPRTDFDGNGVVNISDLFAYITAFTAQP